MESPESRFESPQAFARRHGLGRNTVYEMIRRKELAHTRCGRKIMVVKDALERRLVGVEAKT